MGRNGFIGKAALFLLLGAAAGIRAQEIPGQETVQAARTELRALLEQNITEEMVAKHLGFPWPLPEEKLSPEALQRAIMEELDARLQADATEDGGGNGNLEDPFPFWKVGDEVSFKDKRGRTIQGPIRTIYPSAVKIGSANVSFLDMDEETKAHFNEKEAEKRRNKLRQAVANRSEAKSDQRKAEIREQIEAELFPQNGYVLFERKFISPTEMAKRTREARENQINWETGRREAAFLANKGFVLWEREWITKETHQAILARTAERRQKEQDDLAYFAASKQKIEDCSTDAYTQNLVLITATLFDGKEAFGSGFVLRKGLRKCVVTNQHIFLGAKSFSLRTPAGLRLRPQSIVFGVKQDIAEITFSCPEGTAEPPGFELALNEPAIGSQILVLGNSQGAGVVTKETGKVLGVGPELIEVDAKFVAGNSGSPILNAAGNVLGIATFASISAPEWVSRDSRYVQARRFGVRLLWNAYPEFSPMNWPEFVGDCCLIQDLVHYLCDLHLMVTGEVKSAQQYKDGKHGEGYHDGVWASRARASLHEFERLWNVKYQARSSEVNKVTEAAEQAFRKDLDTIRTTVKSYRWRTELLRSEAETLDVVCEILQDIYRKSTAPGPSQVRTFR